MSVRVEVRQVPGAPGHHQVELCNEQTLLTVLPTLGGRVWQLTSRASGRDWLWQNPNIPPGPYATGAVFDDHFSGGWDVLFPNDEPEVLAGRSCPDHGELWAAAWQWEVVEETDRASVRMEFVTPITHCRLSKTVTVVDGHHGVLVSESVSNQSDRDLPCLWKQHLALALEREGVIEVPASRAELADWGQPRAGQAGDRYPWPNLDAVTMDMVLPPDSPFVEFQYLTELTDSWCGIRHPDGSRLRLTTQSEVLDSVWLFSSFGSWQGIRTVVLEPCTGTPLSVNEGVARGTHRTLPAGATWSAHFTVDLTEGRSTDED